MGLVDRLSLAHNLWRALPARRRRSGLAAVAAFLAPRADAAPPEHSHGVLVAGEFAAGTGVGEAARVMHAACARLGMARGAVELQVGARPQGAVARDAAMLMAVNAPSIPLMLARAGGGLLRRRRVIGMWAWELPVMPDAWEVGAKYVHEVWACSAFTAAALEPLMPGRVRVVPHPLGLAPPRPVASDRQAFGLPAGAVVTMMVFSLGSSFARKNPLAGIAAFIRAFGDRDDQILVVKYTGAAAYPYEAARIDAAAGPNILVFFDSWTPERLEQLLACGDILLSLHRAEGFGLVPAKAMLRAIPVVATGWSGNMTFMDAQSAALVGYDLVPVDDASAVYEPMEGAVWAEPDIAHAAELLRRLGDDAALRGSLGAKGRDYALQALNGDALRAGLAANGIDGG